MGQFEGLMTMTGTSDYTIVIEGTEQVYPCRCGETHKGEYAAYDYGHHNCLHEVNLLGLPAGRNKVQTICPDCGMSWVVEVDD